MKNSLYEKKQSYDYGHVLLFSINWLIKLKTKEKNYYYGGILHKNKFVRMIYNNSFYARILVCNWEKYPACDYKYGREIPCLA